MKTILTSFFLLLTVTFYAQTDSTKIKFTYLEDNDLREIIDLLDIQFLSFHCYDTLMRDKKFFVTISEYKSGNIVTKDTLNGDCDEQVYEMQIGDKLVNLHINTCEKITFLPENNSHSIKLIGKLDEQNLKLKIRHPGVINQKILTGNKNYKLRPINECDNKGYLQVPINKEIPIITYAPPAPSVSGQVNSYCILGEEDVNNWYKKFKIEHYYVIGLIIE